MAVRASYTRNDCLLTFPLFAWTFRHLSKEQWVEIIEAGLFDDFVQLIDSSPYLQRELERLLAGPGPN